MADGTHILSVRVSAAERELLQAAAQDARTNVSDFVRRKSVEAAELELMDRSIITIPAEDWERFEAWVNAPARDLPALRELATHQPAWLD